MTLRRNFSIEPGLKVLVVEDVVTHRGFGNGGYQYTQGKRGPGNRGSLTGGPQQRPG